MHLSVLYSRKSFILLIWFSNWSNEWIGFFFSKKKNIDCNLFKSLFYPSIFIYIHVIQVVCSSFFFLSLLFTNWLNLFPFKLRSNFFFRVFVLLRSHFVEPIHHIGFQRYCVVYFHRKIKNKDYITRTHTRTLSLSRMYSFIDGVDDRGRGQTIILMSSFMQITFLHRIRIFHQNIYFRSSPAIVYISSLSSFFFFFSLFL